LIGNLAPALAKIAALSDDTLEGVRSKEEVYAELLRSSSYENNRSGLRGVRASRGQT